MTSELSRNETVLFSYENVSWLLIVFKRYLIAFYSIAIWNTMMGTSLMTMPWAFGQAGFGGGLIIMLVMAALALYTAMRLLTLQKTMGKFRSSL